MMAPVIALVILCLSTGASSEMTCRLKAIKDSGSSIDPSSETCAHLPFDGPVGTIIATREPTKLARYATNHSQSMVDNMASFSSLLPVVGSYMSFALSQYSKFGYPGTGSIINEIIEDIEKQLDSLKEYVDNKVQEHEHTILTQDLEGFFGSAESCAAYDKEDQIEDLERCLIAFNIQVVGAVGRFTPDTDSIISYDWVLPLFRQYGDLQLTITQDLLRIAMRLDKQTAQDYVERLEDQASEFYDFVVKAINRIVEVKLNFPNRWCESGIVWSSPSSPFASHMGYYGRCTQVFFRNRVCREEHKVKEASSQPAGFRITSNKAAECVDGYAAHVKTELERDLRLYWKIEMLDIADNWKKISEEAAKVQNKVETEKRKKKKKKMAKS